MTGSWDQPRPHQAPPPGVVGLAIATLIALTVILVLTLSPADDKDLWGLSASVAARQLHICDSPSTATAAARAASCGVGAGKVAVLTSRDNSDQRSLLTNIEAQSPTDCVLVGAGFVIDAPSLRLAIDATGGDLPTFLDRHNAYPSGSC